MAAEQMQMRPFTGVIVEEPRICVDYFQHLESGISAFFLSHFHAGNLY